MLARTLLIRTHQPKETFVMLFSLPFFFNIMILILKATKRNKDRTKMCVTESNLNATTYDESTTSNTRALKKCLILSEILRRPSYSSKSIEINARFVE